MYSVSRTFAFLSAATVLWGISATRIVVAQPQPTSSPQPPLQNRLLTAKPDLSLLTKATTNFLKGNAFQTESATEVIATGKTTSFKVQFQTSTIVQAPNRFRAEVSLAPTGKQ